MPLKIFILFFEPFPKLNIHHIKFFTKSTKFNKPNTIEVYLNCNKMFLGRFQVPISGISSSDKWQYHKKGCQCRFFLLFFFFSFSSSSYSRTNLLPPSISVKNLSPLFGFFFKSWPPKKYKFTRTLLLADGTPTVGGGKTFWAVSQIFSRKQL